MISSSGKKFISRSPLIFICFPCLISKFNILIFLFNSTGNFKVVEVKKFTFESDQNIASKLKKSQDQSLSNGWKGQNVKIQFKDDPGAGSGENVAKRISA